MSVFLFLPPTDSRLQIFLVIMGYWFSGLNINISQSLSLTSRANGIFMIFSYGVLQMFWVIFSSKILVVIIFAKFIWFFFVCF